MTLMLKFMQTRICFFPSKYPSILQSLLTIMLLLKDPSLSNRSHRVARSFTDGLKQLSEVFSQSIKEVHFLCAFFILIFMVWLHGMIWHFVIVLSARVTNIGVRVQQPSLHTLSLHFLVQPDILKLIHNFLSLLLWHASPVPLNEPLQFLDWVGGKRVDGLYQL